MKLLKFDSLNSMSEDEEKEFWFLFEKTLANDDGRAAKEHLAAGRWITYRDPRVSNSLIREWPNGQRELIEANLNGQVVVLKSL